MVDTFHINFSFVNVSSLAYAVVRPSSAKRTTISPAQSSYIATGPKMADKADPSQELSVTMGAGHYCRIVGWKLVAFSRLSQFTSPFGLADSLLLRDGSAKDDATAPSRAILCDALPALRVNFKVVCAYELAVLHAIVSRYVI